MSWIVRRVSPIALVALLFTLALPGAASARDREFSGKVQRVTAESLAVESRMGDELTFVRIGKTVVGGEKTDWGEIARGDWVTVTWKITDGPGKAAYKVVVMPPKDD